jgi:D-alanine transfer protein
VPLPAWHFDRHAVSRGAMDRFYERLESTCGAWGYPCFDFSDHEWDEGFTLPNTSHFSEKGWLYVDRVLDDFYHDRLSPPPPSGNAS